MSTKMLYMGETAEHWLHPAFSLTILKECQEDNSTIQIFTDGSKSEQGVGTGAAVFTSGTHTKSLKYRLHEVVQIIRLNN